MNRHDIIISAFVIFSAWNAYSERSLRISCYRYEHYAVISRFNSPNVGYNYWKITEPTRYSQQCYACAARYRHSDHRDRWELLCTHVTTVLVLPGRDRGVFIAATERLFGSQQHDCHAIAIGYRSMKEYTSHRAMIDILLNSYGNKANTNSCGSSDHAIVAGRSLEVQLWHSWRYARTFSFILREYTAAMERRCVSLRTRTVLTLTR